MLSVHVDDEDHARPLSNPIVKYFVLIRVIEEQDLAFFPRPPRTVCERIADANRSGTWGATGHHALKG
jgi:hypothetical protein